MKKMSDLLPDRKLIEEMDVNLKKGDLAST